MKKLYGAYPKLKVIDSSEEIENRIEEAGEINPHIWTSIPNYMKQVEKIEKELSIANPENAELYKKNAQNYMQSLNQLKARYEAELQNLRGKRAICLNEALAYLAKEVSLEATVIETDHEESTLSAEMIKNLIEEIKENDIQIILIGKNDSLKDAQILAEETNAKIYRLNDGLAGRLEENAYIQAMVENLELLKEIH